MLFSFFNHNFILAEENLALSKDINDISNIRSNEDVTFPYKKSDPTFTLKNISNTTSNEIKNDTKNTIDEIYSSNKGSLKNQYRGLFTKNQEIYFDLLQKLMDNINVYFKFSTFDKFNFESLLKKLENLHKSGTVDQKQEFVSSLKDEKKIGENGISNLQIIEKLNNFYRSNIDTESNSVLKDNLKKINSQLQSVLTFANIIESKKEISLNNAIISLINAFKLYDKEKKMLKSF